MKTLSLNFANGQCLTHAQVPDPKDGHSLSHVWLLFSPGVQTLLPGAPSQAIWISCYPSRSPGVGTHGKPK